MMFRYNNPDALLALLLTGATYATMRGLERAQTKWLVLAGTLVGFGFITKMLQAFLILPVMAVVYLLGRTHRMVAPGMAGLGHGRVRARGRRVVGGRRRADARRRSPLRRRLAGQQHLQPHLRLQRLRPADRERGRQCRRGRVAGSMWGPTGLTRLFNPEFGNMMSWLLPGALVMGAVLLVVTLRARRTDRERAALLLWGGSLVSIGLVISLAQGIIHPYYTVALAPPLGALVGIATIGLWQRRESWAGRIGLAAGLAATVIWSYVLLGRTSDWFPALRPFVAVVGTLGVVAILALPLLRSVPKLAIGLVAALGLGAALAAPLFSTVATAATPHNGAIPSVTPTPAGGGLGGGGFPGGAGGFRRAFGGGGFGGRFPGGAGAGTGTGGFPGGFPGPGAGTGHGRVPRWHALVRRRRVPPGLRWRWSGRWRRRVLELESVQSRSHEAAAGRRQPVHVGGRHGELEQRGGLPTGQRRAGDGHRWVQRDRPGADTGPVRDRTCPRARSTTSSPAGEASVVSVAAPATTPRRSRLGWSHTSRPRPLAG